MRRLLIDIPLTLLLLVSLASCGFHAGDFSLKSLFDTKSQTVSKRQETAEKTAPAAMPEAPRKTEFATVIEDIRLLLKKEEYAAALSTIGQQVESGLSEQSLAGEYLRALNGALHQAETLLAEGDEGQAGLFFRAALDASPQEAVPIGKAALFPEEIEAKIDSCTGKLMGNGLIAYRAGDLDKAIGLWKQILAFQPQHAASQNAIDTAEVQRTNLKTMQEKQ